MKKITRSTLFLLSLFILSFGITLAQNNRVEDYKSKVSDPNANFFEIVAQKRAEFAQLDLTIKANNKAMKQFERWAYIWQDKVNADGSFPNASNRMMSKEDYINTMMDSQTETRSTTNPWTQVGPVDRPLANGYVGYPGKGRINVIAEDPTNSNIMYAGSAAGGIWKTTNNGGLWSPKSDFLAGLGVTDILVDPANTSIIYIATGDEDGEHVSSIGVFKSIDAGETWNPTGLTFSLDEDEFIRDLAFAPGSSTKIFALTNTEIRVTIDSGTSWTNIPVTYPFGAFTEKFQNIVFDPNDAMKAVVSDVWEGLYFSTDGGASFTMHAVFQGGNNQKKLKLTSSANDPDFFYGISQEVRDMNNVITVQAEFRKYTYAFADTAADLVSTTALTGFNSQGGYNQNIAVSPINKLNILVAGVNGFRSTDGGATFATLMNAYDTPAGVGFYIHADHHHISFVGNTEIVLNGHDGGIHKGPFSATTATPWDDISDTLIITQPYNISVTQEVNGDNFMMANQDNDGFSKIQQGPGPNKWLSAVAGDGTSSGIDIVNSNIRYLGGTNGQLYRADAGYSDGYNTATYILGSNTDAAFVSQMSVHPSNANIIYACHGDIKKSINKGGTGIAADWTALGSGLLNTKFIDVTANGGSIRIYTIGNVGAVVTAKRSDDDGATWTTITPPAGVTLNSFSAVPNSLTVYASASGYSAGNKVYKSINGGGAWTNISTGLPNIIIKKVVLNKASTDETLYLGTELGPYFRTNVANWLKMGTGLPNVRVDDLEINYTDQSLYIGTFGRGMWRISTYVGTCPGVAKVWNGAWTPAGAPDGSTAVTLNASYDTAVNGNLNACTLTVSPGATLNIPAGTYAKVNGNIIVNETLTIQHEGSLVQVDDAASVTNGGSITVSKTTPTMAAQSFMILGSPMSTATREGVHATSYIVRKHTTANFVPNPAVAIAFPMANNFADDNGNNWTAQTGILTPGAGYLVFPQPNGTASGSYTHNYNSGTLNNGLTAATLVFNGTANGSPNILANPYPSAIDADIFLADIANNKIDALYYWNHLTAANAGYPGYSAANFNMGDISLYSRSMGGVVAANGGTAPSNVIASGQGFAVKPKAAGTAMFKNNMRITGPNDTYRSPLTVDRDRIWVNVNNDTYALGSTTLIGFSENTSNAFNDDEDVARLATPVSLYSELSEGQELVVNALGTFEVEASVNLGFVTQIDEPQNYRVSLQDIDGLLIENEMVYLIDNLSGAVTNLSEGDYNFLSGAGTFSNRFTVVFQNSALGINESTLETISIYPNPTQNVLNIVSPRISVNQVVIYDLGGRIVSEKTFTNQGSYTIDMTNLVQSMYFVTLETANGSITKRVIKQ